MHVALYLHSRVLIHSNVPVISGERRRPRSGSKKNIITLTFLWRLLHAVPLTKIPRSPWLLCLRYSLMETPKQTSPSPPCECPPTFAGGGPECLPRCSVGWPHGFGVDGCSWWIWAPGWGGPGRTWLPSPPAHGYRTADPAKQTEQSADSAKWR